MNTPDFSNTGYDYGLKPSFMILGNIEFPELFRKADCLGVSYLFEKKENGEMIPVQMSFLFRNEEPAEKFFNILLDWIEKTHNDGDAVAIDFIENKKGGYTLAIFPEVDKLIERILPHYLKDKVRPIVMSVSLYKEIETLSQSYLTFKANHKKMPHVGINYFIGTPSKIVKKSKRYFTKKEFNFFKEDEIPLNSMALGYKVAQGFPCSDPKELPAPPKESIEEIYQRRVSEMKTLLPLTYNKLTNLWLKETQVKLSPIYDLEIIRQAICNLTIFERLKQINNLSTDSAKTDYTSVLSRLFL